MRWYRYGRVNMVLSVTPFKGTMIVGKSLDWEKLWAMYQAIATPPVK